MTRTTIVLPPRLKDMATREARLEGVSFGEFVRRAVEKAVREKTPKKAAGDPLLSDRAVFRGDVPADLSRRHDHYLYGEK
jgi:hypothetical protein